MLTDGPKAPSGRANLATLACRQESIWTLYAYTPVSALVVYGGARGPITSRWVVNLAFTSTPVLDLKSRTVVFPGRKGRFAYLAGTGQLVPETGGLMQTAIAAARNATAPCPTRVIEVVAGPPMSAFSFSDDSFRFEGYDDAGEASRDT